MNGNVEVKEAGRLETDYYRTHFSHMFEFSLEEYERYRRWNRFFFRSLLPSDRNIAILDIGCGAGHFLYFLKKEGYRNLFGVDRCSDLVDVCQERVGISVAKEDALAFLSRHPSNFDVITAHHVIEHQDPDHLVSFMIAIRNAVKPGGKIILSTPNAANPWASYVRYGDLTHKLLLTDSSLSQLFASVGIESVRFYPCGTAPVDFPSSLRWLFSLFQDLLFKFSFALSVGPGRGSKRRSLIVTCSIIAVARKPVEQVK